MTDIEDFEGINLQTGKSRCQDEVKNDNTSFGGPSKEDYTKAKNEREALGDITNLPGGIPGSQSIWIKTWGCSHNWSDSEYMAGALHKLGYNVSFDEETSKSADMWVLNSCTVKTRAQNLFETAIRKGNRLGKKIVVAGCVPQGERANPLWKNVSAVGVQQIDAIGQVVENTFKGLTSQVMKQRRPGHKRSDKVMNSLGRKRKAGGAPLNMPKIRRNKLEEVIPINTGCLNNCTYCKTKHARGDLGSYTIEEIVDRVRYVVKEEGVRIVNLESEDTGAYGLDIGTNIGELITALCKVMDEPTSVNAMVRLGISNPPYFLEHADVVAECLKHPRFFSYLHIPVQSGSDAVLLSMKRKYTIAEFNKLCTIMTDAMPDIHLCTDLIAGFPIETAEDWEQTMDSLRRWKFATMYVSPFFARPGTPAALMEYAFDDVHLTKKARVKEANDLWKSFRPYESKVGTRQFWISSNAGMLKDGEHFKGLNKCYEKICVRVPKGLDLEGKIMEVDVTEAGQKYMYAVIPPEYLEVILKFPDVINYIELLKNTATAKQNKKPSEPAPLKKPPSKQDKKPLKPFPMPNSKLRKPSAREFSSEERRRSKNRMSNMLNEQSMGLGGGLFSDMDGFKQRLPVIYLPMFFVAILAGVGLSILKAYMD